MKRLIYTLISILFFSVATSEAVELYQMKLPENVNNKKTTDSLYGELRGPQKKIKKSGFDFPLPGPRLYAQKYDVESEQNNIYAPEPDDPFDYFYYDDDWSDIPNTGYSPD